MGTRLEKYRNELAKARQKRAEIDEKIKELEAKCIEEENTEIHNMVRAANMTPEMLARLLSQTPDDRIRTLNNESEDTANEDE